MRHFWRLSGGLLLATLAGALGGCGLPDGPPVLPPLPTEPVASTSGRWFSFDAPATITKEVREVEVFGYELHYRLSPVGEETDLNLGDRAQLSAARFVRLAEKENRDTIAVNDRPLIEVEARAAHRVTVDFSFSSGSDPPYATWNDSTGDPDAAVAAGVGISLRRGVVSTDGTYEKFTCDRFQEEHADVATAPGLAGGCAGEPFLLQLYVLSYSRDSSRREQFSAPDYLGSIIVEFP